MAELDDGVQLKVKNGDLFFGGVAALAACTILSAAKSSFGKDIALPRPFHRTRRRLSQTLQKIELIRGMIVFDNIWLGRRMRTRASLHSGGI